MASMVLRKRSFLGSEPRCKKRMKMSSPRTPLRANSVIGHNPDIVYYIFQFLPFPSLVKMSQVSKQWQLVSQEDLLWRNLCLKMWPDCFDCIAAIAKKAGSYLNAFKIWFSRENPGIGVSSPLPEFSCPKKRFSLEHLFAYVEVRHRDKILWNNVQNGPNLLNNRVDIDDQVISFQSSPKSLISELSIGVTFFLVTESPFFGSPPSVWISDRRLNASRAMIVTSCSGKPISPFLLVVAEGSPGADRFLGGLRLKINDSEEPYFDISLRSFFMSFVQPSLNTDLQFEVPERHLLALLKRNLHWRPGPAIREYGSFWNP